MKGKEAGKITMWQKKLATSKAYYEDELKEMSIREEIYRKRREIDANPNIGKVVGKVAPNVRNIAFELVESQIESSIPTPKVTARDSGNEEKAKMIEDVLRNELDRIKTEYINDEQERTCPIQGGSYFLIEWDSTQRTHTTIGELSLSLLHPKQVIPQAGVANPHDGDYVFVQLAQTKEYIKRRYGVSVKNENEESPEIRSAGDGQRPADDMVTQNIAYYKNEDGGIGLFSWVNDMVLEDLEDYQARRQKKCLKCGVLYPGIYGECPYCDAKKHEMVASEYEELTESITLKSGEVVPAATESSRIVNPLTQKMEAITEPTKIPYYKPDVFPIVLRKNVSYFAQTLGGSDVDAIRDQQNEINKLLTKIGEKTYKGGSYAVLPDRADISTTDEELKIIRVKTPDEAGLIKTISLQPDISHDIHMLELNYEFARHALGITDSFQGRRDATAISGKAKEFAAAQTAGRLESKRKMKHAAYADLFEAMFKFLLAYADEARPYVSEDERGEEVYGSFRRYDFLEQDAAGEWYYNDRYLFSTDSAGGLAANREAMWEETRENFQAGTFGDPQEIDTLIFYWKTMRKLHYPGAANTLSMLEEKKDKLERMNMPGNIPGMGQSAGTPQRMMPGSMMGDQMIGGNGNGL